MGKFIFLLAVMALFAASSMNLFAQTELSGIKPNLAAGEVTKIDRAENKVSLKTSDGNIDAVLTASTIFKRVPASDIKAAVDSSLAEVGVGDKILVMGKVSADKLLIPAKTVYLITKSDIAKRDAAERDMWKKRGVYGKVSSVDVKTKQIVLLVSGMAEQQKVTVVPKETVSYLRYAPDSVKYADATESSFAEIKVGDQVRALGDKSEDGLHLKAEQVVSGAFKTVVGTITAIDTVKNEITVKDLQNNKLVTILLNPNTQMKMFPKEMATMMAGGGRQAGGFAPPQGAQDGKVVVTRPPQAGGQGGQGGAGGNRERTTGGGNINDFYDNLPKTSIAVLKIGDQIGVSSTSSINSDRLTAIKLLAGVEPFIQIQTLANAARNGRNPSIDIPGLDGGFGAP